MKVFRIILLLLISVSAAPVGAESVPEVQKAAQSVYRVWLGIPLPTGFAKQMDGSHIQAVQTRQFAEQVSLQGMSLRNKKTGKFKPLSGNGIVFQHAGHQYLLIASGSAYAISNKGHLVTNAKLADNLGNAEAMFVDESGLRDLGENGGQAQLFVLTQKTNSTMLDLQPAKTVTRDLDTDLAVVQAENLPTAALKLADAQFAKPADRVFALGAEGESDQLSGKQGAIDRVDYVAAIASEGKLDKRVKQKNVNLWQHTAPISGSQSGGAFVNQCGQVLGTNQSGNLNHDFQAIDVGQLLPMLRKHSIPFEQYQGRCGGVVAKAENIVDGAERIAQAAQHNPRGWLTVLLLAILMFIASVTAWRVLMWILRRRKTNQRRVSAALPPVQPVPVARNASNHHTPMASHSAQSDTPIAPKIRFDTQSISLTAVSGSLNMIAVPANRPITIGRRSDCDVCLNHPQISNLHAKLWQDGGAVWVQDLNSSNGTFVNQIKIQNATKLTAGDILQLTGNLDIAAFRLPEPLKEDKTQIFNPKTELQNQTGTHFAAVLNPQNPQLQAVKIPLSGSLNLGRGTDNDVIIDIPEISRNHCRVWTDGSGRIFVQDLNSKNGTFVNQTNQRISQTELKHGDTLYLAGKEIAYRVSANG